MAAASAFGFKAVILDLTIYLLSLYVVRKGIILCLGLALEFVKKAPRYLVTTVF